MSAKDPLHIPWAFTLADAPRLPLTGERHPLQREFMRWLYWANGVAILVAALVFAGWYFWSHREPEEPVMREVRIVRYTELGVPPSISRPSVPQIAIAQAVAPPSIGVPEPVPDVQAQAPTIATQAEMAEELEPVSLEDLGVGTGDSLVIEVDESITSPGPDEYVPVDEEPVRLRIEPPVYPQMAQDAEVEGTVLVRVLVGTDGRVKDVLVIDGPEALQDAAADCARTAVFKPALVQNQPVEVWVMMPITFRLN